MANMSLSFYTIGIKVTVSRVCLIIIADLLYNTYIYKYIVYT